MLKEIATVVKAVDQDLWVRTDSQSGCNGCAASKGCGISLIDKIFSNKPALLHVKNVHVKNDAFAQVGDKVVVGVEENAFLKASLLVYFLPLVFMIGFALLGHFIYLPATPVNATFGDNNGVVILFSFMGLLTGFICVTAISKKLSNNDQYRTILLEKLGN